MPMDLVFVLKWVKHPAGCLFYIVFQLSYPKSSLSHLFLFDSFQLVDDRLDAAQHPLGLAQLGRLRRQLDLQVHDQVLRINLNRILIRIFA